jgi:hypothetical protein
MNNVLVLSIACVVFTYYGGNYVPKMLKDNKQMLLGVVAGLLLCTFFKKDLVEGYYWNDAMGCHQRPRSEVGDQGSQRRRADDRLCNEVDLGDDTRCFDTRDECQADRYEAEHPRNTPHEPPVKKNPKK